MEEEPEHTVSEEEIEESVSESGAIEPEENKQAAELEVLAQDIDLPEYRPGSSFFRFTTFFDDPRERE